MEFVAEAVFVLLGTPTTQVFKASAILIQQLTRRNGPAGTRLRFKASTHFHRLKNSKTKTNTCTQVAQSSRPWRGRQKGDRVHKSKNSSSTKTSISSPQTARNPFHKRKHQFCHPKETNLHSMTEVFERIFKGK